VTRSLLIAGEAQLTTGADGGRRAFLRAYDKATGLEVGALKLTEPQTGPPMTYSMDEVQYLVVAVSGSGYSGALLAFSLDSPQ